ncbi:hypothetical protein WA026_023033 [Henosepilachna vigintioctopunctata]|uniref:Kazal-like domain-containing protein n=1 Tax=Henosepilachna vigintioctopunctata TaxID=420089 RepID=A0AAW1VBB4_9CUCU
MLKVLIVLNFVIFVHYSVSGLTIDAQSEADKCFIKECRETFFRKTGEAPLCGSDGKPYIHHFSFSCAQQCASKYGIELIVAYEGYCKGKPPGVEYWRPIMEF